MENSEETAGAWPSEAKARSIAKARALRSQAEKGGLRFSAYLPPELASWLLGLIETGMFQDPSEAAFVILGEHRELEPHADLRRELLSRRLQSAMDDARTGIPLEDVITELKSRRPLPEPAEWVK
jgi:hypothetical protein